MRPAYQGLHSCMRPVQCPVIQPKSTKSRVGNSILGMEDFFLKSYISKVNIINYIKICKTIINPLVGIHVVLTVYASYVVVVKDLIMLTHESVLLQT